MTWGGSQPKRGWYRQSWAVKPEISIAFDSPASCHWNRRTCLGHWLQVHHTQPLVGCKGKPEHCPTSGQFFNWNQSRHFPHGAGSDLQAGEVGENDDTAGVTLKIIQSNFHSCSTILLLQEDQKVVHGLQPSRGFWGCSDHTNPLDLCCSNTITTKQDPNSFLALRSHQCSELGWGCCWACLDTGIPPRFFLFNASSLYTGPCLQSALEFLAGLALSTHHKTSEKLHIYSFRHIIVPH